MLNDVFEVIRVVVVGVIIFLLIRRREIKEIYHVKQWTFVIIGFGLIFCRMCVDITNNFPILSRFVIVGDTPFKIFIGKIIDYWLGLVFLAIGFGSSLPKIIKYGQDKKRQLTKSIDDVETLSGILQICASCKKIRDDAGYWVKVEDYIANRTEAEFRHSICPDCVRKLYPDIDLELDEVHS